MKNISSIEICELDFKKGNYKFLEENVMGDVVNPIAFYGHNGSGKSSFFNGIHTLINLMIEPAESLFPFIVNNFSFDKFQQSKKDKNLLLGSIELFFDLDNNEFDYYISTTTAPFIYIEKEYLKMNGETYFYRGINSYNYKDKPYSYEGASKLIPTLRILASSRIDDQIIQKVYSYICSFVFVNLPFVNSNMGFVTSKMFKNISYFDLLVNHSDEVKEILKGYDEFPIYSIVKEEKNNIMNPSDPYSLVLEGKGFKGKLPITMISAGMKNQSVLLSIISSMPSHSVLFVDELEQALHPSAIKSFLKVLRTKDIQLIFSSHNTYILQMLRPDQIYFSKWDKGSSRYYRLSKIYPNIREINNIEKMYLSSIFDEAINNGQ